MKHVTSGDVNLKATVHFMYGSATRAICGAIMPAISYYTTVRVDCEKCIRMVEQCKTVKESEYIKP